MSTPPSQNALDAAIAQANQQQAMASDPTASVFVSASAGSGKTKLLIDRLLRLMLPRVGADGAIVPGSDPARILCLTFTKAAAAEMAIRLQTRLGRWVTLPDTRLDAELAALSVPCTEQTRRKARACSRRCWTCRVVCALAPFMRSASRFCGASRLRHP